MKKQQKTLALWIVVILLMALAMKALEKKDGEYDTISYSEFINAVENNKVEEVTFKGSSTIEGQYIKGYVGSSKNGTMFKLTGNTGDETFRILRKHGIIPNYKEEEKQGLLSTIFINWFPMILLFVIFFFFLVIFFV